MHIPTSWIWKMVHKRLDKMRIGLINTNNILLNDIASQHREYMTQYKDFSTGLVGLYYRPHRSLEITPT